MKKNTKFIKQSKIFLRKIINSCLLFLAKISKTNLTYLGYYQKGILRFGDGKITGEEYVIEKVLKKHNNNISPIFFDVGYNMGEYTDLLLKTFPQGIINAFEPNPVTFNKIEKENIPNNVKLNNLGLGDQIKNTYIYDYQEVTQGTHASIYKEVITDIHRSADVKEIEIKITTIDSYCEINKIEKIDFIKIDTEGNEYTILLGAKKMISEKRISIIQFEFNEMNVISRVFLKDFYKLLENYDIYRIDSRRLIPLFEYNTENEIFKYQNFLAIKK